MELFNKTMGLVGQCEQIEGCMTPELQDLLLQVMEIIHKLESLGVFFG